MRASRHRRRVTVTTPVILALDPSPPSASKLPSHAGATSAISIRYSPLPEARATERAGQRELDRPASPPGLTYRKLLLTVSYDLRPCPGGACRSHAQASV